MPSALEVLDSLPIIPPSSLRADSRICTICWKAYAESISQAVSEIGIGNDSDSETARRLPCGHVFGYSCLHEWIVQEGATSCPMCRTVILGLEGLPGYQGGEGESEEEEQGESGRRSEEEDGGDDSNEEYASELRYSSPRLQDESSDDGTMFPFTPGTPLRVPTQEWAVGDQEVSDQELLSGDDEDEDIGQDDGDDEMEDYEGGDEGDEDDADEEEEEVDEDLEISTPFGLTSQHSGASGNSQKTITELQSPLSPPFQPVSDEELLGEDCEDAHGSEDELQDQELDEDDEDGYDEEE